MTHEDAAEAALELLADHISELSEEKDESLLGETGKIGVALHSLLAALADEKNPDPEQVLQHLVAIAAHAISAATNHVIPIIQEEADQ